MKTNDELIRTIRIGGTIYWMRESADNPDSIQKSDVRAVTRTTIECGGYTFKKDDLGPEFFTTNYARYTMSDAYEDLLYVIKANAERKINETLEFIRKQCKEIATLEQRIEFCHNVIREYERRTAQLKEKEDQQ